jgi:hypothetical protein
MADRAHGPAQMNDEDILAEILRDLADEPSPSKEAIEQ